jgi:hypothetical protein
MLVALALGAHAAEPEEIIVYGDPFARWRGTRWLVETDLLEPLGTTFAMDENKAFATHLFQLRAVLACDLEGEATKKRAEVGCAIEDIAILPTSLRDYKLASERDRVDEVLQAMDAKLTGMTVQLQVDAAGGVTNFDLEGVDADNLRERSAQETMRQVVARAVSGFHLRVPEQYRGGGEWAEYRSALMDMSSLVGSRGNSTLVHRLSLIDGHPILQTAGEGATAISVPSYTKQLTRPEPALVRPPDVPFESIKQDPFSAGANKLQPPTDEHGVPTTQLPGLQIQGWEAPPMQPPDPNVVEGGNMLTIEATYALNVVGVGVFDDGVLSERVWVVNGTPSPSSPVQTPFVNRGRIYKLAPNQHPNLGPTQQVAYPGFDMEGLPPYPNLL